MWESRICWSCTTGLATGYVRGYWRSIFPKKHKCGGSMSDRQEDEDTRARLSPAREVGQVIFVPGQTPYSTVIVAYPKITQGPPLVKRKLGSNHWNIIHEGIQGQKRDAAQCSTDYTLCPQSLSGGCCPTDRVCGVSSCYPMTTATASACGQVGYFGCGVEEGGGCCPIGYVCGVNNCSPSPGVTSTETCDFGSTLCAASFGGCCKSGFSCWYNSCYATVSVTFEVTDTITTTDANANSYTFTTTITSATIPGLPTGTPPTDAIVGQLTPSPTPIPKVAASSSGSGGGLTTPELGGIIGGAIFILMALLVATFFILRRLNQAIKINELANSRTSSSAPRSGRGGSRPLDVDALSVDPLMMTPSEAGDSVPRRSQLSNDNSQIHEMETNSPPVFGSPFSPRTPPYAHSPKGYKPVSTNESIYSRSTRQDSVELGTPPLQHNPNAGYFDLSPQSARQRGSADSTPSAMTRRPSHARQWSNASDQSQVSQNSSNPAELDASKDGPSSPRRSSFTQALHELGVGMTRMVSFRRKSDPQVLTGGPVRTERPAWMEPMRQGLGHIPEAGESRIHLDEGGEIGGISNQQMREIALKDPQSPIVKEGTRVFSQEITREVPEFLMGTEPGR